MDLIKLENKYLTMLEKLSDKIEKSLDDLCVSKGEKSYEENISMS